MFCKNSNTKTLCCQLQLSEFPSDDRCKRCLGDKPEQKTAEMGSQSHPGIPKNLVPDATCSSCCSNAPPRYPQAAQISPRVLRCMPKITISMPKINAISEHAMETNLLRATCCSTFHRPTTNKKQPTISNINKATELAQHSHSALSPRVGASGRRRSP